MSNCETNPFAFYASQSATTDPGRYAALFNGLPRDVASLVKILQGVLLHIFWAERYGVKLGDERKGEVNLRRVEAQLARLLELDDQPLIVARTPERRLVGNCRDFSVLLCAMLRHQGIPARARCGFGAYFLPNHYEDHWVCEYWNAEQGRWIMVDAQLDALQCEALKPPFDPLDVPRNQFITGGLAWKMAREQGYDPHQFGIFDMHGLAFIRGDLMRDFLALNKDEILPWDWRSLMSETDASAATEEIELMDRIAALTLGGNEVFDEVRALYAQERLGRPQSAAELAARIRIEREAFESELAALSPEQMTAPGMVDAWSAKDLIAHLTAWEQLFLGWVAAGRRGDKPDPDPATLWGPKVQELNQRIYEAHRNELLDAVQAEARTSYRQVLDWASRVSDQELLAHGRYSWTGAMTLLEYALFNTNEHYRWAANMARQWKASR